MDIKRQETFEERAAIMEYDGRLPRAQAEVLAREAIWAAPRGSGRAKLMPPEKRSKQYAAFREFWRNKST
jgi:hypothetical protein